ncbi:MAG: ABC transporter permease [Candidatus Eisenbacteria bacterium]
MRTYVLRRVLGAVPVLLGVSLLTFLLLHLAPGDFLDGFAENPNVSAAQLERMRRVFGLDRPWFVQYLLYLKNIVLHLDFGQSFSYHQPVFDVLRRGLGHTLLLTVAGACVTWGLAVPLGLVAAARQGTALDRGLSLASFALLSLPEVLSGLLLLVLAARTGVLPIGGMQDLDHDRMHALARFGDTVRHLVLPALVVGLVPLAARLRQMRSSVLDVMRLDWVTTARAKGASPTRVLLRHVLPNALNPMITLFGFTLGSLLSGAFVAETIFSWPGLGSLTLEAVQRQDQYLVLGAVLMASAMLVAGNLVADLLLAWSDPRIAHE